MSHHAPRLTISRDLDTWHSTGSEIDRTIFHASVLRFFSSYGFKLDGSIPMGKAGPIGFGSRKELWVFRGSRPRPASGLAQREL